jgi:Cof subfamily protein (haloacid dehalogenase superfamily)
MTDKNKNYATFIDIDGTLITDTFTPPERNVKAIERARKRGHKVFINTGRSLANIPDELRSYALTLDGVISGNGSHIIYGGREIYAACFPDSLLESLCRFFLRREDAACLLEGIDEMFVLGSGRKCFGGCENIITSMDDCRKKLLGHRISVAAVKGVSADECLSRFGGEIEIYRYESFFDCVLKDCDKAKGIDIMLSAAGMPLERTIGIGDSANDLPMIDKCAIGVAMGNADSLLKKAADYITGTNKECGVASAIEKLLLD